MESNCEPNALKEHVSTLMHTEKSPFLEIIYLSSFQTDQTSTVLKQCSESRFVIIYPILMISAEISVLNSYFI